MDKESEGGLSEVARFDLEFLSKDHWAMPSHREVNFPSGDTVSVMSEVTAYGNYLHVNSGNSRLFSVKSTGSVNAMFLLPSGEEAYAVLEDGKNAL